MLEKRLRLKITDPKKVKVIICQQLMIHEDRNKATALFMCCINTNKLYSLIYLDKKDKG